MSIDKEKLKALAEKCIERGPRTVSEGKGSKNTSVLNINVDSRLVTVCQVIGSSNPMVDWYPGVSRFRDEANFIGACDPDTILALLEDIDQLKAENEALANLLRRFVDGEHDQDEDVNERHEYHGEAQSLLMRMGGEFREYSLVPNDALFAQRQQLSALRKAADRYTWLRNKQTFIWLIQDWFPGAEFTDVDAEIDAAMAKEAKQ